MKVLRKEIVHLDGNTFEDLEMVDCQIHFGGGPDTVIRNVKFDSCQFIFDGYAGNTLLFLTKMSQMPGSVDLFQKTFPLFDIRRKLI